MLLSTGSSVGDLDPIGSGIFADLRSDPQPDPYPVKIERFRYHCIGMPELWIVRASFIYKHENYSPLISTNMARPSTLHGTSTTIL
jgi:hypothetical protein